MPFLKKTKAGIHNDTRDGILETIRKQGLEEKAEDPKGHSPARWKFGILLGQGHMWKEI